MSKPALLLHVGYHKTATTWMQTKLFMPENGYRQLMSHQEIHDLILAPHELVWDAGPARALIAERMAALGPGEVPVVSSEILSGQPFTGARESGLYAYRLAEIAPEGRIMLSIRAQMKILPSIYMQYLLQGGTLSLDQFFFEAPRVGFFRFWDGHFEYDLLLGLYQKLFGRENTFILQQERLRSDAEGATAELAAFAGNGLFKGLSAAAKAPHPPSYPEYAIPVLRRLNHFKKAPMQPNPVIQLAENTRGLYRHAGNVLRRAPFRQVFANSAPATEFVKSHFQGRYAESNAKLAEICANPLDLSRY